MLEKGDEMSLVRALMHAFKRPDETTANFAAQIKALTDADKAWYKAELIKAGYKIV